MRNQQQIILRLVLALALGLASAAAWALDPSQPPGSNFDLSYFYLQLPTEDGSLTCTAGSVDEVSTSQLVAGFTNAYFYTGTDGAMVFWAPINGATTSGSSYPRSELREELVPGNTGVNWTPYGTHILNAQCQVLQVPASGEVVIGQAKGYSGAALPLVLMEYESGTMDVYIKTNSADDGSSKKYSYGSVGLSNNITYQINIVNGLVTVIVNSKTNSLNVFQTDPGWETNTVYFKAGDYCQYDSCTNPSTNQGARVAFYALTRYHAPSITNQPASQNVLAGSNVTFTVGALGNPPLMYGWQLNNTPINNATNTSLILSNVQPANTGNYSVVVTDITGVVTSSVAALTVVPVAPVASFTNNPASGAAPLTVNFFDTSTGSPTNWSWTFGDGVGTSAAQNPSYTYDYTGTYTVTQIVANAGGSSTNTGTIGVFDPFVWWQQAYGLSNNCALCGPSASYSGDGMSNTNKFLAGFNPTNPAAYLHIIGIVEQLVAGNTNVVVTYLGPNGDNTYVPGIASRTNVLDYMTGNAFDSYTNGGWQDTGQTNILGGGNGSGAITSMTDSNIPASPDRYYRVRVLVP